MLEHRRAWKRLITGEHNIDMVVSLWFDCVSSTGTARGCTRWGRGGRYHDGQASRYRVPNHHPGNRREFACEYVQTRDVVSDYGMPLFVTLCMCVARAFAWCFFSGSNRKSVYTPTLCLVWRHLGCYCLPFLNFRCRCGLPMCLSGPHIHGQSQQNNAGP